jgi:hypothetical protein
MKPLEIEFAKLRMERTPALPHAYKYTDEEQIADAVYYGAESFQKSKGFIVGERVLVPIEALFVLDADVKNKYGGQTAYIFGITKKKGREKEFHVRFDDGFTKHLKYNEYQPQFNFKKIK